MAPLKLHTYPGNKNANKALIAAKYAGVAIDVPRFQMGVDNKTPAFLKLNPNGKVRQRERERRRVGGVSGCVSRAVCFVRVWRPPFCARCPPAPSPIWSPGLRERVDTAPWTQCGTGH